MAATPEAPAPAVRGWLPADPGPLGLAAFAMTTFVLSMYNSNLMNPKGEPVVLGLALAYGGIAQLLAGMWEFRTGNTFGAVAFTSFGAFWLSFWALLTFYGSAIDGHGVALYLWGWAIFTAYMCVASLRTSAAVFVVFLLLTITFILLAIGDMGGLTGHPDIKHAGGYVGLATAIAAWYASFAAVVNSTFGRVVLPVRPLTPSRPLAP
jgi:succinate-acetate transporter protein